MKLAGNIQLLNGENPRVLKDLEIDLEKNENHIMVLNKKSKHPKDVIY